MLELLNIGYGLRVDYERLVCKFDAEEMVMCVPGQEPAGEPLV